MKNCWSCAVVLAMCGWTTSVPAQQATTTAPVQSSVPGGNVPATTQVNGSLLGDLFPSLFNNTEGVPADAFGPGGVRQSRFYFTGEYLLWWTKQDKVPPLSSTSGDPFDNGIIGNPTTELIFGGDGIGGGPQSGFRFGAGFWLDNDCKQVAVEVRGFYLAPTTTDFSANSNEYPTLARPFFNVNQGIEFAEITAFPGRFTGSQYVDAATNLFGAEANLACCLCCGCNYRADLFGGFRFVELQDSINFVEDFHGLPTAPAPYTSTNIVSQDFFSTRNEFYGPQFGMSGEYNYGILSFEARAQLAVGDTHQTFLIDGDQALTPVGSTHTTISKGDLYALPSNIGRYERDRFSVIPEIDFNVGVMLTRHLRAFVGYDFLYWNNVARAGEQIDRNIDITQVPNFPVPGVASAGQTRPSAPRDSTDFWAQGVTFGFEFRY